MPHACMPRPGDYAHMWWAEGFPDHTPRAPWQRVIQTGFFAVALDTEAMRIGHLGVLPEGDGYEASARSDNSAWQTLPAADLALWIKANGKRYRCVGAGKWEQFSGPRLIESGRFVQRADVTSLVFRADDGAVLNAASRFEAVAWPDRLALIMAAKPGIRPIPAGEACFGRIGGGFGLDGSNHFEIPHSPDLDPPQFTLELWAFAPLDYQVSRRTFPWLVCKNRHEQADGNYGIAIVGGTPQARMNIGGGRQNEFVVNATGGQFKTASWNHFAMSYDGESLAFYVNGALSGRQKIGRKRAAGKGGLAFGRRQDNAGDGYHFRGAIDEVRIYRRALSADEVRARHSDPGSSLQTAGDFREWRFNPDGQAAVSQPGEEWGDAGMEISLATMSGTMRREWMLPVGQRWSSDAWREVSLVLEAIRPKDGARPAALLAEAMGPDASQPPIGVAAYEITGGATRPVSFDAARGWHCVNLDGVEPLVPPGGDRSRHNDAIERVRLSLSNPGSRERAARLLLEKHGTGIRQRIGAAITGISAILRDAEGRPTGIPVQLSKNWHARAEGGVYAGTWFHGFSLVRVPAMTTVELELTLVYGHWGGVPAASHSQLCLIGWGSNQLWDQSALGSWGESICYEPDQAQASCGILDVRPVMVRSMSNDAQWSWTHNVGGGDFFRLFDVAGKRVFPGRMRTAYLRHGPCLTEIMYAGRTAGLEHAATVSLARADDIVRGTYRLRLDATTEVDFSRFVIFQVGADTYSYTGERKFARGNENGLVHEWDASWGGDVYRTKPAKCVGAVPWISLHEAVPRPGREHRGAWANRGIVIRSWEARLGGKKAAPWVAERGVKARGRDTSTIDIIPPPGVTRLEAGDFIDLTVEHIIMPQFAEDYYGPNHGLRDALKAWGNTWRMIHREATGNHRRVAMSTGALEGLHPAIAVRVSEGQAEFHLEGGIGYVPVTFKGMTTPIGHCLVVDGKPLEQGVHGNDFWQTDYDPASRTWQITYNVPVSGGKHLFRLQPLNGAP